MFFQAGLTIICCVPSRTRPVTGLKIGSRYE